jgi:hypothetical protein
MQKPERVALYSLLGLLLGLVLIGLLLLWAQSALRVSGGEPGGVPAHSPIHEAEFESGAMRAAIEGPERARLESYGWVNRERGLVHIPVSRAMKILEER